MPGHQEWLFPNGELPHRQHRLHHPQIGHAQAFAGNRNKPFGNAHRLMNMPGHQEWLLPNGELPHRQHRLHPPQTGHAQAFAGNRKQPFGDAPFFGSAIVVDMSG
jgi:hypothetical protein